MAHQTLPSKWRFRAPIISRILPILKLKIPLFAPLNRTKLSHGKFYVFLAVETRAFVTFISPFWKNNRVNYSITENDNRIINYSAVVETGGNLNLPRNELLYFSSSWRRDMIMYVHAVKMVEEVPVCLSKSSVICFACSHYTLCTTCSDTLFCSNRNLSS